MSGRARLALAALALLLAALALLLAAAPLAAQGPPGYYDTVDATNAATLRATLHEAIDDHTRFPYTAATTDTWDILNLADEDPNNTGNIIDVAGTLYVKAADSDGTAGAQVLDSLFVDEMYVETSSGGGTDTTPPAAPTGLTATAGDGSVSLDWADNGEPDLDGYNVYRATSAGGPYSQVNGAPVGTSDYLDNGVTNGTTYYYVVTALDTSANESGDSNEASATPQAGGATTMHVAAIVPSTVGGGKKKGRAVVTVVDNTGAPVSGAQVTGTFSGTFNETVAAGTDAAGAATLDTSAREKEPISFTFCVDAISHGSLAYEPGSNVETCDGI